MTLCILYADIDNLADIPNKIYSQFEKRFLIQITWIDLCRIILKIQRVLLQCSAFYKHVRSQMCV